MILQSIERQQNERESIAPRAAYGVHEVAEMLGVSVGFVRKEVYGGRLKGKKFGTRTLILAEDLQNYLQGGNHEQNSAVAA